MRSPVEARGDFGCIRIPETVKDGQSLVGTSAYVLLVSVEWNCSATIEPSSFLQ